MSNNTSRNQPQPAEQPLRPGRPGRPASTAAPQAWPGAGAPNWPPSPLIAAALWRLTLLITLTWAAVILGGAVLVLAVPTRRRFVTGGGSGACWPVTASSGCATKPACTPGPGRLPLVLWTRPTKVGERAPRPVPRRDLRRGLRSPHRRTARRLLRPRRPGHPQPPLVPTGDHRHHPPRHPRRQPHRALTPARSPPRPAPGRQPTDPRTGGHPPPLTQPAAGSAPGHRPGPALPSTPEGRTPRP